MKKLVIVLCISLIFSFCYGQNSLELLDPKVRDILHESLSGEIAKEHVIQISRYHRVQGSREYRKSANYVLDQLRKYRFSEKDAYIESFKSDGKVVYQTWQSPSGWDMEAAELRMVEPYEERIVSFPEVAMSLITYSNPGDETAELIWVGSGTSEEDYKGKNVTGKIVLATGYGGSVHRLAVLKYGAKAVVCYLDDDRAKDHPDMLAYTGMWPLTEELDHVTFGFNISKRQGEKLRNMLETGQRLVLHGWAKGIGLEPFFMDVPVAFIRGSEFSDEEIVFCAHLDHPKESANDNASGSAALIDIARSLKELIDSKRIPRPKRTLRLLWVPEFYGTMAYIDKHEELVGPAYGGKFLANLNLDMVGENLEMIHTKMILTRTPDSCPSILNDVVENMAQMVDRLNVRTARGSKSIFNFRVTLYSGGSDHNVFIDRKVPSMMIGHSPDYTHHTSDDVPERVDPVELERTEIIAASTYLYLANLNSEQAVDLVYLAAANSTQRLGKVGQLAIRNITTAKSDPLAKLKYETENLLAQKLKYELETIHSVTNFNNSGHVKTHLKIIKEQIKQQHKTILQGVKKVISQKSSKKLSNYKGKTDKRVPIRLTRGPLGSGLPDSKISAERLNWYQTMDISISGNMRFELVNFIDGKNSVSDIRDALSAEFNPVDIQAVAHFIEDLISVDLVNWK